MTAPETAAKAVSSRMRLGHWLRLGLSLLLGMVFVALAVRTVDFGRVYTLVGQAALAPLLVAFFTFTVDFLLRAIRFWAMLQLATQRSLPLKPSIAPFIASFGMSDLLPLRIGDGFRAVWFCRQYSIPAGTVIGTMVVERILDLVTLVALGAGALVLVTTAASVVWNFKLVLAVAAVAGIALLFAPGLLCWLVEATVGRLPYSPIATLIEVLRETSRAVMQIGSRKHLAWLIAMSLALWLLESMVLIGAWMSLGGSFDALIKPLVAFVFSTLGTLLPSLPGHFGSFEYFGLQAFALTGVEASMAAAVVLLAHLILWAPTALFAIGWFAFTSRRGRSLATPQD